MQVKTTQIPFDFFVPEAPRFDNFIVGANSEPVACLQSLASASGGTGNPRAVTLWGGPQVGKSHLLAALVASAAAHSRPTLQLSATDVFPAAPFVDVALLIVDDADRLGDVQQAWLFTAFNHIAANGGTTVVTGGEPPARWPLRDDLRTRMGSGLIFEIAAIPPDALAPALSTHAAQRGIPLSDEVLTYILNHNRRDIVSLSQLINGIDRLSLALKRPVTVPLLRSWMAAPE